MMVGSNNTLVLRTPTASIVAAAIFAILLGGGGVAGGIALAYNGWWILGLIAAFLGLLVAYVLVVGSSQKYIIDEDGVESRSLTHKPRRIRWVDVTRMDVNGSVTFLGSEPGQKLRVSAGIKGFTEFLDLLENRIEYEHWLRAAAVDELDISDEGGVFRRKDWLRGWLFFSVLLWVAAIAFSLRSDVFAGQHLPLKGRGAIVAIIFNFLFVDQPFLGILTLSGLAFAATYHATRGWHTLRVEQEGLEFDSLLKVRPVLYEQVIGLDYKIGRAQNHGSVQATKPILLLKLEGGEEIRLFAGKTGIRVKDAIEAAIAAHLGEPEG
jgi:hypothetical protein